MFVAPILSVTTFSEAVDACDFSKTIADEGGRRIVKKPTKKLARRFVRKGAFVEATPYASLAKQSIENGGCYADEKF